MTDAEIQKAIDMGAWIERLLASHHSIPKHYYVEPEYRAMDEAFRQPLMEASPRSLSRSENSEQTTFHRHRFCVHTSDSVEGFRGLSMSHGHGAYR